MKPIDLLYILLSSTTFIGWLHVAKDAVGIVIASLMSIISLLYLYYKMRKERAEALKSERELKNNG